MGMVHSDEPNLEMIRLILRYGADPDMTIGPESSAQCLWQRLRQTDNPGLHDAQERAMTFFKDWARKKCSIGKVKTKTMRVFGS